MKRKRWNMTLWIVLPVLLFLSGLPTAAAAETAEKTVRVGYFTMENFMEGGVDGSAQSGFTYELLCEIASYNHWNMEYVFGDFSTLY